MNTQKFLSYDDDILKNKNIDYYYKRNDKKYADMQQLLTQACTAVINIANNCLDYYHMPYIHFKMETKICT